VTATDLVPVEPPNATEARYEAALQSDLDARNAQLVPIDDQITQLESSRAEIAQERDDIAALLEVVQDA
jgi:hypothetical protein